MKPTFARQNDTTLHVKALILWQCACRGRDLPRRDYQHIMECAECEMLATEIGEALDDLEKGLDRCEVAAAALLPESQQQRARSTEEKRASHRLKRDSPEATISHAEETQSYGTVTAILPIGLPVPVREEMVWNLNQILADTMTIRDLYRKCHWQVTDLNFYPLHLLFDKHFDEQIALVDKVAERIQTLGGISIAMPHDVAETTTIERPPRGREKVQTQLSRLLAAHELIIKEARKSARRAQELGDDATSELLVSSVVRTNEIQTWFLSEHLPPL